MAKLSSQDQKYFDQEGYTLGALPEEYQKFFGNDPTVVGWKATTNPNGTVNISVAKPQGDADGGLQFAQYGNTIREDKQGNLIPGASSTADYSQTDTVTPAGGAGGAVVTGSTGSTPTKKVVSTYTDPTTGDIIATYEDGSTSNLAKSGAKQAASQSAYDLLYQQFNTMGLGSLVEPLKTYITEGISPAEFTLRLQQTPEYQQRFAANKARIAAGLTVLSPAEYIGLEDQYQNIMRNYGLPESYYSKGSLGTQAGFQTLIGGDVSATELEDRIMTAQNRVLKSNPEVLASLKAFYPDITNGDILSYTLDPKQGLDTIKRKVTAAEIGGAASQAGLNIAGSRAEELTAAGISKAQAQQGYQTIAEITPRGSQLAAIYGQSPYTYTTAEQEVFGLAGSTEAAKQRKKLVGLEKATFAGSSGMAGDALNRDRALSQSTYRSPGAGNF
jgi:hypothetical protein